MLNKENKFFTRRVICDTITAFSRMIVQGIKLQLSAFKIFLRD